MMKSIVIKSLKQALRRSIFGVFYLLVLFFEVMMFPDANIAGIRLCIILLLAFFLVMACIFFIRNLAIEKRGDQKKESAIL